MFRNVSTLRVIGSNLNKNNSQKVNRFCKKDVYEKRRDIFMRASLSAVVNISSDFIVSINHSNKGLEEYDYINFMENVIDVYILSTTLNFICNTFIEYIKCRDEECEV